MKLWCFGDSNTYGYDPCGFFGGQYAGPWPALLAEKTGFQVVNDGKNGRMIPEREYEFLRFRGDAERVNADALIVMLGTNDLHQPEPLPEDQMGVGIARMVELIQAHPEYGPGEKRAPEILLIAPPFITPSAPDAISPVC